MKAEVADAPGRIRVVFEAVVEQGLRADTVSGASDHEIDRMAAAQRARKVPAAVREVLRIMGRQHGLWLGGSALGVSLDGQTKDQALVTLSSVDEVGLVDAEGLLVLVDHQSHSYHVVDGADQKLDDPPVWLLSEGETVAKRWDRVTVWFEAIAPDVAELREELEMLREIGHDFLPPWARYLEGGAAGEQ